MEPNGAAAGGFRPHFQTTPQLARQQLNELQPGGTNSDRLEVETWSIVFDVQFKAVAVR
jgi:hypothetical protein